MVTGRRNAEHLDRSNILVQDLMGQFYVFIDRLLHELAVLEPVCLWDDVPYQLLNAGVDVFLGIARHGRILTAAVKRGREGPSDWSAGRSEVLDVRGTVFVVRRVLLAENATKVG